MFKKTNSIVFILAGGSGTRLAPLSLTSESKLPKQFLALVKKRTMLQEAINRVPKGIPIVVIPEEKYKDEVIKQSEGAVEVVAEPFGCNTAAAIGLAAVSALQKGYDKKTVLFIMPADHYMDTRYFRKYYEPAVQGAAKGKIVAMGITPDRPETGYGYIKGNKKMQTIFGKQALYETEAFVEKPDQKTAEQYVESKEYFWNAGIFAFSIETILKVLEKHAKVIFHSIQKIKDALGTPQEKEVMEKEYKHIKDQKKNISIDYAVMEKEAKNIFLLPADLKLAWNDVGGWIALEKYVKADEAGNRAHNKVEFASCNNVLALNYRHEHAVKVKNMQDMLIVDTDNGVLICPKLLAQRAKEIIPHLDKGQKEILIEAKGNEITNDTEVPVALIGCADLQIKYSKEKCFLAKIGDVEEVVEEAKPEEVKEEKIEKPQGTNPAEQKEEPKEEKPKEEVNTEEKKDEVNTEEKAVEEQPVRAEVPVQEENK